jgi:hypothetical protein
MFRAKVHGFRSISSWGVLVTSNSSRMLELLVVRVCELVPKAVRWL